MTAESQGQADSQESRDSEKPNGTEASGHPNVQQHPISGRRRHWGRIVAVGAILLLGPALWFGVRPMLGVITVDVTEVSRWYDPVHCQFLGGMEVDLLVHNPFGNDIADMEVFIDRWTDDRGKDLFINSVPLGQEGSPLTRHTYYFQIKCKGWGEESAGGVSLAGGRARASKEIQIWITSPVGASADASTATVAGRAIVTFGGKWWNRRVEVPFEVTKAIVRKDVRRVHEVHETPVPDSAWGPKGEGRAEDVLSLSARVCEVRGGQYPKIITSFYMERLDPREIASYNATLTACYDDVGTKLLGGGPVRTAVGEGWSLYGSNYRNNSFFEIILETTRLPDKSATSVTYEGLIRVKVAEGEESVELKDIPLDPNKSFNVGPLEFRISRDMADQRPGIETRGDWGMIRGLTVTNDADKVHLWKYGPCPADYWEDTYGPRQCPEGTNKLTVKAEYFTRQWHYDLPFKVTVPLNATGYTMMKPASSTTSSRPAGK